MVTGHLLKELPSILNWSLTGPDRLGDIGHLIQPTSSHDVVRLMEEVSSPILAFVDEDCLTGPEHQVTVQLLFGAWRCWYAQHGREHPGTVETFAKDLLAAVPGIRRVRPRGTQGNRQRRYQGIGLQAQSQAAA